MNNLKNKVALVTGGSRGIGKSISLALAQKGVNLFFTYREDELSAKNLLSEINNFAGTGNTLFVVGSEAAQNALTTNENDIVVRTDILTVFTRKDPSTSSTGTVNDYQQATSTLFEFLNNLNVETGSGLIVKDAGVSRARSVEGVTGQTKVSNGDGVGGNIKVELQ